MEIMNGMDILNRVFNKNDKATQLQNEIKSLLVRRDSVVSVVQGEIFSLEEEKSKIFSEAGAKAYEAWKQGQYAKEELEQLWSKVRELETQINEKENKKAELEGRYDEEISMLQRDLNSVGGTFERVNQTGKVCPKCGAEVRNEDVYCEKCGCKLR